MIQKKYILMLCVIFLQIPDIASAGSASGGKITLLLPESNGVVSFIYSRTRGGAAPSCGATYPDHWAIDASTIAGQALAAAAITAFAMGNTVNIQGASTCLALQPDQEAVSYLAVIK